jgi:hypothetical protein
MRAVVVCLVAAVRAAAADPGELGESSRGRSSWSGSSALEVAPVIVLDRHGHPFEYDWNAEVEGIAIDHDRFYELVGRPDLARNAKIRRALGILTIAGGIAASALGVREVMRDHPAYGVPLYFAGAGVAFAGTYLALEPDPTSASEAQQLASQRPVVVGLGANF